MNELICQKVDYVVVYDGNEYIWQMEILYKNFHYLAWLMMETVLWHAKQSGEIIGLY